MSRKPVAVLLTLFMIVGSMSQIFNSGTIMAVSANGIHLSEPTLSYSGGEVDKANFKLEKGEKLTLSYEWKMDSVNVGESVPGPLTIAIPDVFTNNKTSLKTSGKLGSYGDYVIDFDANTMTLTMEDSNAGLLDVAGTIEFSVWIDTETQALEVPYTLSIPLTDSLPKVYTINFDMSNQPVVEKTGKVSESNPALIDWEVLINKNLASVDSAIVLDTLDSKLIYDPANKGHAAISIRKVILDTDGGTTPTSDVLVEGTDYIDSSNTDTINLSFIEDISEAYVINYQTYIDPSQTDIRKSEFSYTNSVAFNGETASDTVKISKDKVISKASSVDVAFNTNSIDWTIQVNESNFILVDAKIEDTIPDGLSLDGPIIVKRKGLLYGDADVSIIGNDMTVDLNLAQTTDDFTITYTTKVADSAKMDNLKKVLFTNTANLIQDPNGSLVKVPASKSVTITKGVVVDKYGRSEQHDEIMYNDDKYIDWTIDLNTAEVALGTDTFTDRIADISKQTLVSGSVVVYDLSVNTSNGKLTKATAALDPTSAEGYVLTNDGDQGGFNLVFKSPITKAYRIEYRTKIDKTQKGEFENKGTIAGYEDTKTLNPDVASKYTKTYLGTDFTDKTLTWAITVDPIYAGIPNLKIVDSFLESDGLMMTEAQFDAILVKKSTASVTTVLQSGVDYEITKVQPNKIRGFELVFKSEVNNAIYAIEYATTMDPDVLTDDGDLTYKNTAVFYDGSTELTSKSAKPNYNDVVDHNGSKSGKINVDARQIEWEIRTNHLSKHMNNMVLVDTMTDNQKLVSGSIDVVAYALDSNGAEVSTDAALILSMAGDPIPTSDSALNFIIDENDDLDGFDITYPSFITGPYLIKYKTDFFGISEIEYENTAVFGDESYTKTLERGEGHNFIVKSGVLDDDLTYVDWTVGINESLSEIDSFVLTDVLSEGLRLSEGSFSLRENKSVLDPSKGSVEVDFDQYFDVVISGGKTLDEAQTLTLTGRKGINKSFTLTYRTYIILESVKTDSSGKGVVSNDLSMAGHQIIEGNGIEPVEVVVFGADSSGSGTGATGGLSLNKVDNLGQAVRGAIFDLYRKFGTDYIKLGQYETDASGHIIVDDLRVANYRLIEVSAPEVYIIEDSVTDFTLSSSTLSTMDGEQRILVNIINNKLAELGDYVWLDKNKNGLQDNSEEEVGVKDVIVKLYKDSELVAETKTDQDGYYKFSNLEEGTYTVIFEVPKGYQVTEANLSGGDDGMDSDGIVEDEDDMTAEISNIVINYGDSDMTNDLGIYEGYGLGDYVWYDEDYDGLQGADEMPVSGVIVTLKDSEGNVVKTTTTNEAGYYEFTQLVKGTYSVEFDLPDGYGLTIDNDGNDDTKDSDAVLSSTDSSIAIISDIIIGSVEWDPSYDMGLYIPSSLGDYVWYDNKDGRQDEDEEPVEGMTVTLYDEEGIVATTLTDEDGYYLFDDLKPGTYKVVFEQISGYKFVATDVGGSTNDDSLDSDADRLGETGWYDLGSDEHIRHVDAGIGKKTTSSEDKEEVEEESEVEEEEESTEVIEEVEEVKEYFTEEEAEDEDIEDSNVIVFTPTDEISEVKVKVEPEKGTIEIKEDNSIIYTPGPEFDGTDQVTLIITNDDGDEEEFTLDIFDDIPQGGLSPEVGILPETGGTPIELFIGLGSTMIGLGYGFKKRKRYTR